MGEPAIHTTRKRTIYPVVKRMADVTIALTMLIIISPLMLVIAILIRITMGKGVLFRQTRAGYRGRPFEILKFRTMHPPETADGTVIPEADRITPLGRLLRKTSLDELPQLWNVVRGDMSLIGPRPLYVDYLKYYTEREQLRHEVRPGITGLAQVSGRNYLPWDERLELDVRYVENLSFSNDVKILIKTVLKVLSGSDITVVPGEARMLLSDERRHMSSDREDVSRVEGGV